jgi:hypothetical protein
MTKIKKEILSTKDIIAQRIMDLKQLHQIAENKFKEKEEILN